MSDTSSSRGETAPLEAEKLKRLDEYLDANGLEMGWLAQPNNFSWLTGGSNVVSRGAESGVAAAGYDGETITVVANNIEAVRLREEELPGDVDLLEFDWHEATLREKVAEWSPIPAAADVPIPGFQTIECAPLRLPLTDDDIEAYRILGRETATAVESVCRSIDSTCTERAVAGALEGALGSRGIFATVALVGSARRAQRYRHYTPTDVAIGEYALLSVTATRSGLHASCTRTVAFDPPSWLSERHAAAMRVEATALRASLAAGRASSTRAEIFATIQDAYATVGYPDEWRHHHQGGATGYAGREWVATPSSQEPVRLPAAFAWNPTVVGAKSEDTVLVTEHEIEILTKTDEWPTKSVSPVGYDEPVDRPEILIHE